MNIIDLPLKGLKLVELKVHGDSRGFFVERFNSKLFEEGGLPTHFAQDNHSRSAPDVLRGVHFQFDPPQGKLVGCVRGSIWDVAVDLRVGSPTFGQNYSVELSDTNGKLLWIPAGFGHGFCVTSDAGADVYYKVDRLYNPKGELGINWNDPELSIPWPVKNPAVSARDAALMSFADYKKKPVF